MLSHILKTAFSHLWKNKSYALLNILGLSLGIASVFLIFLFLKSELSYDRHFEGAQNIYRVGVEYTFDGKVDQFANAPRPMASTLQNELPQVVAQTRLVGVNGLFTHQALFNIEDQLVKSDQVFYADSTYFRVFDQKFIVGNPETALTQPNSLVVSEQLAKRLFNSTDILGNTLKIDNALEVQITGVFRDSKQPTHLPIEALVSWVHDERPGEMGRWIGWHVYTYVKLNDKADITQLQSQLPAIYQQFMEPTFIEIGGTAKILTQPLLSIHLESDLQWEAYANGDKNNVYVFLTVALFIILLVAINYTNLATAKALQRFKEIGVRKILGSSRKLIFIQLITDSFITTLIATFFGLVIILLFLPFFGEITQISLDSSILTDPVNLSVLLLLFVFISIISSLYPAIHISRFHPVHNLNSQYSGARGRSYARKTLVTLQFFIAVALLFATATVIRQSAYMRAKDLGFDREHTMVVQVRDQALQQNIESLKNDLLTIPGVTNAASTKSYPGQAMVQALLDIKELDGSYTGMGVEFMEVGIDFPQTLGMEVMAGRSFDKSFATDLSQALMVNEAGAKVLGGVEEAIGRQFGVGEDSLGNPIDHNVIGVVKDFHTISLHNAIQPIVIFPSTENTAILIKTDSENNAALLNQLEAKWNSLNSDFPFEYTFLDDDFISLHNQEADLQQLLTYFSILIVFIACLGLLGLVSYTTRRKAREITIRKVVGSSDSSVMKLMLSGQLPPIVVAMAIAIPTAWYFMNQWLNNFAYHTTMQWTHAAIVVLIIVMLALLTMAYHILKAARTSPTEVLRHE